MRELTYEECMEVSGAGRWGWIRAIGSFFKDILSGAGGSVLADHVSEQDDIGGTITYDPSNGASIVDSGTAWGESDGQFQAGWYWTDSNGMTYWDMNMDGSVDSRSYVSDDGTYWQDNMDNNWRAEYGPPN